MDCNSAVFNLAGSYSGSTKAVCGKLSQRSDHFFFTTV